MTVRNNLSNLFVTMDNQAGQTDIFNFVDSELLDKYYVGMFGNRNVSSIVKTIDIVDLAKILNDKYLHKWNSLVKNYLDSENVLQNYQEIITETNDDLLKNNNTRTSTNRVSAFDDDEFVNKDEDVTIDNSESENNRNKNIIRTKVKEADFYEKVNNYLTNFDIYNIMVIDINSIVTLNIFN